MKKILLILSLSFCLIGPAKATIYDNNVNDVLSSIGASNSYAFIQTVAVTNIKASGGTLKRIIVNGGTAGGILVYDNTTNSGQLIASFDSTNALANYNFDVGFANGLTVQTSGNTKLTVVYN